MNRRSLSTGKAEGDLENRISIKDYIKEDPESITNDKDETIKDLHMWDDVRSLCDNVFEPLSDKMIFEEVHSDNISDFNNNNVPSFLCRFCGKRWSELSLWLQALIYQYVLFRCVKVQLPRKFLLHIGIMFSTSIAFITIVGESLDGMIELWCKHESAHLNFLGRTKSLTSRSIAQTKVMSSRLQTFNIYLVYLQNAISWDDADSICTIDEENQSSITIYIYSYWPKYSKSRSRSRKIAK